MNVNQIQFPGVTFMDFVEEFIWKTRVKKLLIVCGYFLTVKPVKPAS